LTPVLTYLVVEIITNEKFSFFLSKSDEFSLFYYEKELKNEEMNAYNLCRNKIYYKLKLRNRDMNENGNLGFLIWRSAYFR